ncbi:dhs-29 [Pristionchus pacificus]|uniref:Dhs-29 n=1 Tax=Pristionchus pacificus TaxID=54126 RepID=A0A2A6B517_PRIPA|nr:dhs-29 [Pristionchus pacificus]|eukprot:PDM60951.1 dhs-29 [Pristionchus pacificus]
MDNHTSWVFKLLSTLGVLLHVVFIDFPKDVYRWMTRSEKDVSDSVVVITGAGSGLGRKMAYYFAVRRKARVALIDVNEEGLRECCAEIDHEGGDARLWVADIRDAANLNTVAEEIDVEMGPVSIVVCNAAVLYFGAFLDLKTNELQKAMDINIMGTINTIRAFLTKMEQLNSGHIVTVSSIAGFAGETYGLAYCPTKFAVRGVMECLQMELRDRGLDGIVCTTLCPYFARTPMILNVGMRPTSTWIPFMSISSCARLMVSAILEEQTLAFIPSPISLIALTKSFCTRSVFLSLRDYLNCRYDPPADYTTTRVLTKVSLFQTIFLCLFILFIVLMSNYFRSVHPIWWAIIPPALLLNFIAFYAPNLLRVIPVAGPLIADFSIANPQIVRYTNLFAVAAHAGEGLLALGLSVSSGNSFATSFKWFVQTFIFGFPSLRMILGYKKKAAQGKKKSK